MQKQEKETFNTFVGMLSTRTGFGGWQDRSKN